jgi:hypothetical protein
LKRSRKSSISASISASLIGLGRLVDMHHHGPLEVKPRRRQLRPGPHRGYGENRAKFDTPETSLGYRCRGSRQLRAAVPRNTRRCVESTGPAVCAVPPVGCIGQAQCRGHYRDRPRNGRLHLGNRPPRPANGRKPERSASVRRAAVLTAARKALWICRCAWTTLTRRPQLPQGQQQ